MIGMGMEFWGMGFSRKTYENSRTTKKRMRVEAQYRECDETLIITTTHKGDNFRMEVNELSERPLRTLNDL